MSDIKNAMAMEREYRKLRSNWQAKTAFGYHDKLKAFGFADTIEYERAKDENYFTSTKFDVLEIGASEFISELQRAIKQSKETVFIVHPETLICWTGTDPINEDYCLENKIPVYPVGYHGGAIVTGVEDVAIGLLVGRSTVRDLLVDKVFLCIKEYFPNAELDNNDIVIDGYKVFGVGRATFGALYLATYQITFKSYPEAINNICLKPMFKIPKGLSELGDIEKKVIVERVKSWLQ
jgi:hypothetical protein